MENKKTTKVINNNRVASKGQDIISIKEPEKYVFLEEYRNMLSGKRTPLSEKGMRLFADELVQWAIEDEKAIRVEAFHLRRGIASATYYDWIDKYEVLRDAHNHAMSMIGMRTYEKAFNRQAAENVFKHLQHTYDGAWRDATLYHNAQKKEMQQEEESVPTVVNVYTNDYSSKDSSDEKSIKGGNE